MEKYTQKQELLAEKNFLKSEIEHYKEKTFIQKCGVGFLMGAPIGLTLSLAFTSNPVTTFVCILGGSCSCAIMQYWFNERCQELNQTDLKIVKSKLNSLENEMTK